MVVMKKNTYIPPAVRQLPIQSDTVFCVSCITPDPYVDDGDYEWN